MSEDDIEFQVPQNLTYNPAGLAGIYEDRVHLKKTSKALNDLVIIEILEQDDRKQKYGNIILPTAVMQNFELVKGKVLSAGPDCAGVITEGSIVFYDKWSAFYKPPMNEGVIVITKAENIIGYALEETTN